MSDWRPATRLPDPAVEVLDPRFTRYVVGLAKVERIATTVVSPVARSVSA